jgi:hypothetical protein
VLTSIDNIIVMDDDSRGQLTPQCNAAAYIDVTILGEQHMYQSPTCKKLDPPCPYFDPEGLVRVRVRVSK